MMILSGVLALRIIYFNIGINIVLQYKKCKFELKSFNISNNKEV